ncbi:hypothetical protein INR49_014628 [Caranx melampygus]|nr:hypothetical protein INR49_014628 [Caranx melampygus]
MAESSSEPAAVDLLIEPTLTTETVSKELIVTTATEGPQSDTGAKAQSSNGDADSPLPGNDVKDEATPPPPESSLLSSENGTSTTVATDESVSSLLRHIETEGGKNRAGDQREVGRWWCNTVTGDGVLKGAGVGLSVGDVGSEAPLCPSWLTFRKWRLEQENRRRLQSAFVVLGCLDLDMEDSSSVAGGSEDQRESTDSASFSIPSLELSDGVTVTGNSLDVDDGLSSTYSALGAEAGSLSTEVPSLKDDETSEAAVLIYRLWSDQFKQKMVTVAVSRGEAKLPAQTEVVTTEDLMAHLGECVLSVTPREKTDGMELNFQQSPEMVAAVGKLSYNQLVEKIIDYKHSADSSRVSEGSTHTRSHTNEK